MHVFLEYMTLIGHLYTKTIVMDIIIYYRNYRKWRGTHLVGLFFFFFFFIVLELVGLLLLRKLKQNEKIHL